MLSYIHYTDSIPAGFGGVSYGPYIRILPKYRNDAGIHAHEQVHANQWWAWMGIGTVAAIALYPQGNFYWYYALLVGVVMHAILYRFVHGYRLWCEVQAYRKQMTYYADDRSWQFAGFIANKYGLNLSQYDAHVLLTKK